MGSKIIALMVGVTFAGACVAQDAATQRPLVENDKVRVTVVETGAGQKIASDQKNDNLFVKLGDFGPAFPESPKKANAWAKDAVQYVAAGYEKPTNSKDTSPAKYVQVQFQHPSGKYVAFDVPVTHYCNPGTQKACVNEQYLFCTDRFCVEAVTLGPGAASTQHTHTGDHIVIATNDFKWREEIPGAQAVQHDFKAGDAMYVKAGVTHRLINNGGTTARLVMVQFK